MNSVKWKDSKNDSRPDFQKLCNSGIGFFNAQRIQHFYFVEGEVICIFNSRDVYDKLKSHQRINKFCFNSANAGVSRSWNIGLEMAEGRAVFIMNADLHVRVAAIEQLEHFLFALEKARAPL